MAYEYRLSYTAEDIDEKLGKIDNAVLYAEQALTDEQKAQARANIGAAAVGAGGATYVTPQMFGAKGDGVTDDTEAFLDAIDAIVNNGGGTLYIPVGEYIMTAPITFYCDKMDIVSDGAILNWGSISNTSHACVHVVTHDSYAGSDDPEMYHNNIRLGQLHKCSGVIFKGITDYAIRTYGNLIGVNYEGKISTGEMCAGFNFEHCVFYGFDVAVRCYSNSWVQGFIACNISDNNVAIEIPAGGGNYCERVTIIDSNIHSNVVAVKIGHSDAHIHAIGCSFDYNDTICNLYAGRLYLTNCHLESTRNNGNWFSLTGGLLMCKSCEWYASGNNYLGTVSNGAVAHVDGGYFVDVGYTPAELFAGAGGIYVNNMFPLGAVNSIIHGKSSDTGDDTTTISLDGAAMIANHYMNGNTGALATGTNNTSACDRYVEVEAGKSYILNASTSTGANMANILFYDANKTYTYNGISKPDAVVENAHCLGNRTLPAVFTVPEGMSYIRFHIGISEGDVVADITDISIEEVEGESSDTDDINVDLDCTALGGSFITGHYITTTGEVMVDGNMSCALYDSFVKVSAGKNYTFNTTHVYVDTVALRFYDENKNYVSYLPAFTGKNFIFTVPYGCSYLRLGVTDNWTGFATNPIYASDCTFAERAEDDVLSDANASMTAYRYIDYTNGELLSSGSDTCAVQTYVPVEPGASYRLSTSNTASDLSVNMCFYDANRVYTYDGDSTSSDLNVKAGSHSLLKKTLPLDFVVPADCHFMRFHSSLKTTIGEWTLTKLEA